MVALLVPVDNLYNELLPCPDLSINPVTRLVDPVIQEGFAASNHNTQFDKAFTGLVILYTPA